MKNQNLFLLTFLLALTPFAAIAHVPNSVEGREALLVMKAINLASFDSNDSIDTEFSYDDYSRCDGRAPGEVLQRGEMYVSNCRVSNGYNLNPLTCSVAKDGTTKTIGGLEAYALSQIVGDGGEWDAAAGSSYLSIYSMVSCSLYCKLLSDGSNNWLSAKCTIE